jgi:hypothetical protein
MISTCAFSEECWREELIVKHTFINFSKVASRKRIKSDSQIRYCDYGESTEASESLADEDQDSTRGNRVLDSLADAETASEATEPLTDDDDFAWIETSSTVTELDFDDIRPCSSLSSVAARLEIDAANLERQAAQVKAQAQTATEIVQCMSQAAEFRSLGEEAEKGAQLAYQAALLSAQVQEAEAVAKLAQCKAQTLCLQINLPPCLEAKSQCIDVALAPCMTPHLQQQTASKPVVTQQAIGQRWCLQSAIGQPASAQGFTTLMLRNIPNNYTRNMLIKLLDQEGFSGHYSLVYVPVDFIRFAGLGYAFVDFSSNEAAEKARQTFQGFKGWNSTSKKVCDVLWSRPLQGLSAHIELYRNSPVMHESVPECYKPALFQGSVRLPFPGPTKEIRPPRVKYGRVHTN